MDSIEKRITELGGYIENMESYNGSAYSDFRSSRNSSMTVRIPAGQLNVFLSEVSEISNVVRRTENVQDVTLEYVDIPCGSACGRSAGRLRPVPPRERQKDHSPPLP